MNAVAAERDLVIERLSVRGEGVARDTADGATLHVPGVLPGETVRGLIAEGRMPAPAIVTPSPDRVRAPCVHYRACGGCALQHGSDDFVAGWKADIVRGALAGQGIKAEITGIETSPPRSRRRAVFAGRRTKKGVMVGFHARASGTVVEIPNCILLEPELVAALPVLEQVVLAGASRKGGLDLTLTSTNGGLDLSVTGGKPLDPALFSELSTIAETADLARLAWEGETIAARRPPAQSFGPAEVVPPAGGFLQATRAGEAALLAEVVATVGPVRSVIDLFAGSGTFGLSLSRAAEVHAVEGQKAALEALDQGWRRVGGLRKVTTEVRDLFRRPVHASDLNRFGAVVIDPPRAGAEAQAEEIAASTVKRVASISCNPLTFARDARILLEGGYRLDRLVVVDQFRWSPHVEVAARFLRD